MGLVFPKPFTKDTLPSSVTGSNDRHWIECCPERRGENPFKNFVGAWMIFCNGRTELDRFWSELVKNFEKEYLHEQVFHLKISTGNPDPDSETWSGDDGLIVCLTRDFRNLRDVKTAAEKLRKILGSDKNFFYKIDRDMGVGAYKKLETTPLDRVLYRQLPDGSLWLYLDGEWEFFEESPTLHMSPSPDVRVLRWTIPTRVFDIPWIYCMLKSEKFPYEEDDSGDEHSLSFTGKWMIFGNSQYRDRRGLTQLDRFWFKIVDKFQETKLWRAKVSTGMDDSMGTRWSSDSGIICCFTRDYRERDELRLIAEKLREVLKPHLDRKNLFYKTDRATHEMQYQVLKMAKDKTPVSLYRHCSDGTFWENIQGKWEPIE